MMLSTFDKFRSYPSLAHSSDMSSHHGPLIYKNYKTVAGESVYTSTTNDSCLSCAFLLSDRSHTIVRVPHLTLLVLLVSMALAPLSPSSSQILDSGLCHGPGLCILCTTLLRVPLAVVPYLASKSTSLSIDFVVVHEFVGLPTRDSVSVFHATSSPSPILRPGLKASAVTTFSSVVVSKMPQTMRGAAHPLASY